MATSNIDNKKISKKYSGLEDKHSTTLTVNANSYTRITLASTEWLLDGCTSVISGVYANHAGMELSHVNGGTYVLAYVNNRSSALSNRVAMLRFHYIDNSYIYSP